MRKRKHDLFKIFTLDAAKIVERARNEIIVKGTDRNFHLNFRLDLSNKDYDVIQAQEVYADNALFWQICKVLPCMEKTDDALKQVLVFVDFNNVFSKNLSADTKTTPSKQDLFVDMSTRVKEIFAYGMELSFEGEPPKRFVAFDKSSSMARKCFISFLAEDLKAFLDKRLMLDMDLSGVPIVLSKYYAYRGLYLSTGLRIQSFGEDDDALTLNEKTVIVLPDFRTNIVQDVLSAVKNDDLWECTETTAKLLSLNSFDGEGLICPNWAARLNSQLNLSQRAYSFQIRLPFTKGVLHEVDFVKFFREEFHYTESTLPVRDIFGIERDLLKAKIILTESMFKCGDWIKKWTERPADPLKFFFEKMSTYEHALWVCNTDANLQNTGKVSLNYQFLSTLDCTLAEVDSLVKEHIELINAVPQSVKNIARVACNQKSAEENFEDEFVAVKSDTVRNKCLTLLNNNEVFLDDPKIKTLIDIMQRDLEKALCLGQFYVQGEVRFLSCDLLMFLLRLAQAAALDSEKVNDLETQVIRSEHFYMPEKILAMKCDKYYAFLRSPHLSRNEQCLLRPFVKLGNLYDKYFSHLTGVVMVSCKSSVPLALGGADFDGDIVKIISDKRIVDSVKRGAYVETNRSLKRKFPVIEIPAIKAVPQKIPNTIPFKVVQDTFSNQVGRISNLAVKFALLEYAAQEKDFAGKCAECTIVVGLEIDAAKTGVHPDKNIDNLKSIETLKSQFLDAKNFFEKRIWTTFYNPHVIRSEEHGCFELYLLKRLIGRKKAALSVPIR